MRAKVWYLAIARFETPGPVEEPVNVFEGGRTEIGEVEQVLVVPSAELADIVDAHLREAVRLIPDSAETHNNLGTGLWFKGTPEEAISQFRRALEIDPNHVSARENLSSALNALTKTASAGAKRRCRCPNRGRPNSPPSIMASTR